MTRGSGRDADQQAMLAALKILAREKGNITRLRAQLPGAIGQPSADATMSELGARGVLAVKPSATRVPASLHGKGDAVIRQELAMKLLRDADIDAAMSELPPEAERATEVARKKWPTVRGQGYERANRLVRFLMGRGFSIEASRQAALSVADIRPEGE